jgi:hypothetical protein
MGQKIQTSSLMEKSYSYLLDDLRFLRTNDPFIVQTMSGIEEHVIEFQSFPTFVNVSADSMSIDFGLSMLSKIIKFSPCPEVEEMDSKIFSIIQSLGEEKKWY